MDAEHRLAQAVQAAEDCLRRQSGARKGVQQAKAAQAEAEARASKLLETTRFEKADSPRYSPIVASEEPKGARHLC